MATEQQRDLDALALHYFDTELDNLLEWQASEIEDELRQIENREREQRGQASGETGYCFECGVQLPGNSSQCGGCKEGIPHTPPPFDHTAHRKAVML
jgi:hypothetical protein